LRYEFKTKPLAATQRMQSWLYMLQSSGFNRGSWQLLTRSYTQQNQERLFGNSGAEAAGKAKRARERSLPASW